MFQNEYIFRLVDMSAQVLCSPLWSSFDCFIASAMLSADATIAQTQLGSKPT